MNIYKCLFLLIITSNPYIYTNSFIIDPKPICCVHTQNSVLAHQENHRPLYIGTRQRYATCTGVTWFHGNYIASLHLLSKKIITYHFDPATAQCTFLQKIDEPEAHLIHALNITASPDGSLLAVCSDGPYYGIAVYTIDQATHMIQPKPVFTVKTNAIVHSVRFSHDNKYLATAGFADYDSLSIYKVNKNNPTLLSRTSTKKNTIPNIRAKSVNFTKDNQFLVAVYSPSPKATSHNLVKTMLSVYEFNSKTGALGKQVCFLEDISGIGCVEDCAFLKNDTALILSDNARDMLTIYQFNPNTGCIDPCYTLIENPEAQLSFPHGLSVSEDGQFLAVSNFGDDKFSIYTITERERLC